MLHLPAALQGVSLAFWVVLICRLYCSSQCRLQDKGTPSPAIKPAGVRLTSQIPVNLSPMLRPTHHQISPSPRLPASHADSSSSSSITSSPIQSPRTNPADSPRKGSFDLPPLAYPKDAPAFVFPGSMPVKIPNLVSKPAQPTPGTHTPASGGTVFPIGASIDTLRFGRRPGTTNSVVSPNALVARCACGKPANHRGRAMSKDRGIESGLANFVLGPSVNEPVRTARIASDSSSKPYHSLAATGHNTPDMLEFESGRGASYLSRSRSDPIPSVLESKPIKRSPVARRTNHYEHDVQLIEGVIAPASLRDAGISSIVPASVASPRRGRSRDRQARPMERDISVGILNHPPEREHPPSRSRHRREGERRRSDSRERHRAAPLVDPSQITPSWNRRTSPDAGPGEGVAPAMRRTGSGRSPEAHPERKEEHRRASHQLGAVFGVAAG